MSAAARLLAGGVSAPRPHDVSVAAVAASNEDECEARDSKGAIRAGPLRDHEGHCNARRPVSRAAAPKHSPTSTIIALTECNL